MVILKKDVVSVVQWRGGGAASGELGSLFMQFSGL